MNNKTIELLEYNKIKDILKGYALSEIAKNNIEKLEPSIDKNKIEIEMRETTEARNAVNISSSIPLHSLAGINGIKEKLDKGIILSPEDLETLCGLLKEIKKMKRFMGDKQYSAPTISSYIHSAYEMEDIREEIEKCIVRGTVDDRATSALWKIRRKIYALEDKIKVKLEAVLRNEKYKTYIQDSVISQRNGRYVIPVKSSYRKDIEGSIHDKSNTGSTTFIEPVEVKKAQDELESYRFEEEKEVYKILSTLTNLVCDYKRELNINIEIMSNYDFIFAKGKYSKAIDGRAVSFNTRNYTNIIKGKHPLIGQSAVPLDFEIGKDYKGVIITGPNTGGKTVALKTLGLITMMAQSALHVPVEEGSEIGIFGDILVDIGDGQSIEQNLSTFSSHIKNIINILDNADKYTLVILDEIGSGTDPGEGMGIAISVLEELYDKGATICATTHYNEIKNFAERHEGFINGSMEFDIETLKPLYRLNIGKPGESNAFLIALRLGMEKSLIEKAHEIAYKEHMDYSKYKIKSINKEDIKVKEEKIEKINILEKKNNQVKDKPKEPLFNIGDCVYISFMNRTGVICEAENSKGEYGVMVMRKKIKVNKKRLSRYIDKEELYPEEYDFDIVFESKENRKKNKVMNKRHVDGMIINVEDKK